ncbi:protein-L-isoaspartate(D-aspartate) O-methyltransferase [Herbaspirillum sp. Sphag1AN]|uniref:protein-L-isoaspartate(D-aspartate) O-methyltransferase n=1 Tax=unclassified Herbaspirillum TaxID=2624150 RepID=UPI001613D537|nr:MULTISPECIES: protein-L-isoaspartate(D-aspartate) O-methyltransferase [unclassified Herbaspirillum]MBB3210916.1 protein-L-isoaspartate(D-aspartate) O-methyltransferase [Herbaspirillum sp. Sphag1AN]MBB3244546.1 protein-L-isoaspartate(D-aspartate) O-methyltransferase [Herbaspirillum sp. Sphag64]
MSAKQSRFPLTLSSVVEKKTGSTTTRTAVSSTRNDVSARSVVTPQTATRNAAQNQSRQASKGSIVPGQSGATSGLTGNRTASRPVASNPAVAASVRTAPLVSDAVRKAMVARVAKQGVRDSQVLAAMEAVPRHLFMEPALSSQAYIDASLPIGHHQTISQPYIVARMIEIMRDNQKGKTLDRVLEIGTGCGYQAAVLSLVAKEVYSIERIKPLHELAKNNLRPLRIANIRLHYGDGMLGLPQVAPFDGIILAAAGLEVPQALLEQLAIGGRLVAPVGARQQMLQLIVRVSQYEWLSETLEQCHFVPLRPGTV